jgi:hypothetical protein
MNLTLSRSRRKFFLIAIILAACAGIVFVLTIKPANPAAQLPKPNGYDDFLKAGEALVPVTGDWRSLPKPALASALAENSNALALLRRGLPKEYAMPFFPGDDSLQRLTNLANFKGLAQWLVADGSVLETQGRIGDAAHAYVDAIEFGERVGHGVMIDDLVAIAIKSMGRVQLERVTASLDGVAQRELLTRLLQIDARQETAEAVLERERDWSKFHFNTWHRAWARWVAFRTLRDAEERLKGKHARSVAELRMAVIALAIRIYQSEHGALPQELKDLVPKVLKAVPVDPFSGQPLRYLPRTNAFVIYSVGPDRKDDGGAPLTKGDPEKGDIVIFYFLPAKPTAP